MLSWLSKGEIINIISDITSDVIIPIGAILKIFFYHFFVTLQSMTMTNFMSKAFSYQDLRWKGMGGGGWGGGRRVEGAQLSAPVFWKRVYNSKEIVNLKKLSAIGYINVTTYPLTKNYYFVDRVYFIYRFLYYLSLLIQKILFISKWANFNKL